MISSFLTAQLDYIFFFYGLSFVLLAVIAAAVGRIELKPLPWKWLALFGLVHGLNEWLDMLAISLGDSPAFGHARLLVMVMSFVFLVEFGRVGTRSLGWRVPGPWIHLVLLAAAALGLLAGPAGIKATSRYAFGFVGALWTAAVFHLQARRETQDAPLLRSIAAFFGLYAVLSGVVAPQAPFFPANVISHESFAATLGFPVQLLRGAVATVLAALAWVRYLQVYEKRFPISGAGRRFHFERWFIVALVLVMALGLWGTETVSNYFDADQRHHALSHISDCAAMVNPRRVATVLSNPTDTLTPDYVRLQEQIDLIRNSNAAIHSICILAPAADIPLSLVVSVQDAASGGPNRTERAAAEHGFARRIFATNCADVVGPFRAGDQYYLAAFAPIRDLATRRSMAVLHFSLDGGAHHTLMAKCRLGAILVTLLLAFQLCAFLAAWQRNRMVTDLVRESERRLKEAQQLAHLGNWELDLLTNRLTWSDEIYRIFEIDPTRFGASYAAFLKAIHPEDREAVNVAYTTSVKNRMPYAITHRLLTPDGRVKFVHEQCETHYSANGTPLRSVGTVQDVTERSRQQEIASARARLIDYSFTHSLDELLTATLDEVGKLTGSPIGFYHFLDDDQTTLSLQAWSTRTVREFCTAAGKGSHYDISKAGVWVDCVHERKPVIHNDYASLPHKKGLPPGHAPVTRELVVPIMRGNKIMAIIGVGNKSLDYGAEDVEIVSTLADLACEITERKRAEEELKKHLWLMESLDKVNRTIQGAKDHHQMMNDALEAVLSIFDCDRTWLFYPCDPDAPSFRVPMEIARPEYPGAGLLNADVPMPPDMARNLREALESADPVTYAVGTEKPVNQVSAEQFGVQSMMMVALYPKSGKPWAFGLHQCSSPRIWTKEETRLFKEISFRISDGLSSLLFLHDLQESQERYRVVFENSPVSIWEEDFNGVKTLFDDLKTKGVTDIETFFAQHPETIRQCADLVKIVDVNRAALALHAAANKEELLAGLANTYTPEYSDTFRQELVCLWNGGTEMASNAVVQTLAGAPRNVAAYFSVCPGHEETLSKVLVSLVDITQRMRAEEKLRKLNIELEDRVKRRTAELEEANCGLESFSYSVSHDLRAPLRGIDGFSQALAEDCADRLDGQGKSHLARIRAAAQRMALLIDDLLHLSRVSRQALNLCEVNLSALVRNIGEELARRHGDRKVSFRVRDGLVVRGDPPLLEVAITNLLENAWKFTARTEDPEVEFGMEEKEGRRIFFVRDNGAGFDMKYADKLFSAFQRLHAQADYPGTGIGLSIVQRIIRRHGGEITADASAGGGATFRFWL